MISFLGIGQAQWAQPGPAVPDLVPASDDRDVPTEELAPAADADADHNDRPVKRVRFAGRDERTSLFMVMNYSAVRETGY